MDRAVDSNYFGTQGLFDGGTLYKRAPYPSIAPISSIRRHRRVNLPGPGQYASLQVVQVGKPVILFKPVYHVPAAGTAPAVDDDFHVTGDLLHIEGYFSLGDQFPLQVAGLKFMNFPDVNQLKFCLAVSQLFQFLHCDFFHINKQVSFDAK